MKFSEAFFDELEKVAVTAGGVQFHSFKGTSRKQLSDIRPKVRTALDEGVRNLPVVGKLISRGAESPSGKKELKKQIATGARMLTKDLHHSAGPDKGVGIGGFASVGSNHAFINRNKASPYRHSPTAKREVIAHEAFHAKHPILGRSEALARVAGGWKAPRKAGVLERAKSATNSLKDYWGVRSHYK